MPFDWDNASADEKADHVKAVRERLLRQAGQTTTRPKPVVRRTRRTRRRPVRGRDHAAFVRFRERVEADPASFAPVTRLRAARGLSVRELSRRAGVSPATVTHLANRRPVEHRTALKLARALGTTVEALKAP